MNNKLLYETLDEINKRLEEAREELTKAASDATTHSDVIFQYRLGVSYGFNQSRQILIHALRDAGEIVIDYDLE